MKRHLIVFILLVSSTSFAMEADALQSFWRSPTFVNHFMGTYGVRGDVEPSITEIEQADLEQVAALMQQSHGPVRVQRFVSGLITKEHSAVYDFTLASAYFQMEKFDQAALWYQRAIDKFPDYLRAHKNLGMVRVRQSNFEAALPSLTKAVELGAVDHVNFGLIGYAHLMTESYASAETAYRMAIMMNPQTIDWKLGLTRCLLKQQKFGETVSLCNELIATDPKKVDYWKLQANAYLGLKQPLKAAENYEYMLLQDMADVGVLNGLGDIYMSEASVSLAADAYKAALAMDEGQNASRFIRSCKILSSRGGHEDANAMIHAVREKYAASLTLDQKKELMKLEARVAAALGKSSEKQGEILEAMVALDGLDGAALILLGKHYAGTGDFEKAYYNYERAANLDDFRAEATMRHGQALVKNKAYKQALPLLEQSYDLKPSEKLAGYIDQVKLMARQ